MQIEQRGEAPYEVWSGRLIIDRRDYSEPEFSPGDKGHRVVRATFDAAIKELFSLTEGGKDVSRGGYIRDANSEIVFTVDNGNDAELLRELNRVGFVNLIVTLASE